MARIAAALALVFLIVLAGSAARGVELRWKLGSGETVRYRLTTDQRARSTVSPPGAPATNGEEPVETRQRQAIVWRMTVLEVDSRGLARIACRYESIAVDMEQMMLGRIAWDSTRREDAARSDDPVIRPFATLVGLEFQFGLGARGEVVDVRGFEKVRDAMLRGLDDNPFARAALTSGFGEDATRAALERAFAFVPEKPVEPGATWSTQSDQSIPLLGTLRYATTWRLAGLDGGAATIEGRTALSAIAAEPANGPGGPLAEPLDIEWKGGEASSTIQFSIETGRVLKSETRARMALRSKVKPPVAPADGPSAVAADVAVEQTSVVELLKDD